MTVTRNELDRMIRYYEDLGVDETVEALKELRLRRDGKFPGWEGSLRERRYFGLLWSDGMIEQSGDYSYSLDDAREIAKREQQSDPDGELPKIVKQTILEYTLPWEEVE